MKINSAEFKSSAPDLRSCPAWTWPEFALIGRSNVGKSSLINLITGRRDLAKVSATPGKTRLMNFFLVNGRWSLVDLPGYGYAKVGKEQRADFNEAVADYIANRPNLRRIFVLIDSRLEPQAIDVDFLRWLERTVVPYAIVFTKADKQSGSQTRKTMDVFRETIGAGRSKEPTMIVSSAKTGVGRGEIFAEINTALSE